MASESTEDRTQEGRKHIYVINGVPEFLNLMRDIFQDARYNVTTTNFVPRSFEQIEAQQPDAIIVDVAIGQQVGWDLLAQLHEEATTTGIPVLVVSTDPKLLELARNQASRLGALHYLSKPFDLTELLETMEGMIGDA